MLDNRALYSTIRRGPEVIIRIEPCTELDVATAPVLDGLLAGLDDDSCERVVVDLAGVDFIDSTGLRVLLMGQAALRARGIALVLRNPRRQALRLFDVAGVLDVLRIENGVSDSGVAAGGLRSGADEVAWGNDRHVPPG